MTETTAPVADASGESSAATSRRGRWLRWGLLTVWGPGLVVMLADTDAGSLITASQSGAQWGYRMVLPQLILMPILYVVQEMTVRLGIVTKKGHGALIRERFGRFWAWISAFTLFASAIGALLTEFAGVAGVGELFGVSRWVSIPVATAALLALALTGSYRRVERIGLVIGAAELAFLVAMVMARPEPKALVEGLKSMPLGNSSYLLLVAANVGAVIMPWMVFYQQGAVVDKHLSVATIRQARHDTAAGAVLTQLIMISVVITVASTIGAHGGEGALNTVGDIANALTPYLGRVGGTVLFGLGMLGAALVAAIVSSLAGAWGLSEVFGWKHTLNQRPNRATAKFYITYALAHLVGAVLVLASVDLVNLAVDVEVMNALLLPIVLGLLLALEARALPEEWRMRGPRKYIAWALCLVVMGFGLYMVPQALGWS
ncbi:divalent metal cation transporter [Mycobacterium paraense]|uniref:NRAMP family metal ion transporter n=1 Tax=Mycobacterium paraense TaxID=767916 RepID=A0A1X2A8N1_9MYCO|nr:divalent metal cation transporter [Mycobacterium paraense]MCV7444946.1 divalent metal cation transporter [Mycobacterium paraense]ORW39168.1 NRAMP family metal ion transporter [Mycobacterium paraense]ORW44210.1 NRAMP family metal ion transporter [Mycobacterium paraense]